MWEDILIHMGIGAVLAAIKNPAKAATLKAYLLEVADSIYEAYGVTPPAH